MDGSLQNRISNVDQVFDGRDYQAWRDRFEIELRTIHGCEPALVPVPPIETNAARTRRENAESKAYGLLASRLKNEIIHQIRGYNDFRAAWAILETKYRRVSSSEIMEINRKLYQVRLDFSGDVYSYFNTIDMLIGHLQVCGIATDDATRARYYLQNLPPSMQATRQTCTSLLDSGMWTSQQVRANLCQEAVLQRSRSQSNSQNHRPSKNDQNSRNGNRGPDRKQNGSSNGNGSRTPYDKRDSRQTATSESPSNGSNGSGGRSFCTHGNYKGKNFDLSKVLCYRCKKNGHYANNCPTKDAGGPSANVAQVADNSVSEDLLYSCICSYGTEKISPEIHDEEESLDFQGDSGCNAHIIREHDEFLRNCVDLKPEQQTITLAKTGTTMKAIKKGDLQVWCLIDGVKVPQLLKDVYFVPDADRNLLSTLFYMENGYELTGSKGILTVTDSKGRKVLQGKIHNTPKRIMIKMYLSSNALKPAIEKPHVAAVSKTTLGSLVHDRFGHMSGSHVRKIGDLVIGIPSKLVSTETVTNCEVCAYAKLPKLPFSSIRGRATRVRALIHCDLVGPIEPEAEDDSRYILVIVDDWSHYSFVRCIKTKDETLKHFRSYVLTANTIDENKISKLRCDNGTEFTAREFTNFCEQQGIEIDFVPAHTPELNGVVERYNGTLGNRIRALLFRSKLPIELWHYIAETASYLLNRSPTDAVDVTPYEKWFNRKPDVSHIRIIGSIARVHVPAQGRLKLDKRAWNGLLVGYSNTGYKIYDIRTRKIVITREVRIDESKNIVDLKRELAQDTTKRLKIPHRRTSADKTAFKCIIENRLTFEEAVSGKENREWKKAIRDELAVMESRKVWEVVDQPINGERLVDTVWVFRKKVAEGIPVKYKARLCARGFKDDNYYHFSETYSPTAKLATVRILLALAVEFNWELRHLDVTAAFLYGVIEKPVYSKPPQGITVNPGKVIRFNRSIYGLKPAARNWNKLMVELLARIHFKPLVSEPCVFSRSDEPTDVVILVFVDDFLVTGSNSSEIQHVIEFLQQNIEINDLGPPKKFLGIQITRKSDRIELDQTQYFEELQQRFKLKKKQYKTPMEESLRIDRTKLIRDDSVPIREILGSLMYAVVCTRPDIAYSVNSLCRVQDLPSPETFKYAKRILSYLLITEDRKLTYLKSSSSSKLVLSVRTDASFASDLNDRKSTSGIVVKLGHNTIHWRCVKQAGVTKSTQEAEYMALSAGESEQRAIWNFLNELGIETSRIIYTDSAGARNMILKRDSQRCRHVEVAYRAIEEMVATGKVQIEHLPGAENEADILTKAVKRETHERLTCKLLGLNN